MISSLRAIHSFFLLIIGLLLVSLSGYGQTNIVIEGLNNSSTLFTLSGGAYFTGNSASGDRVASSPFAIEGSHSRGVSNGTATLTSSDINTTAYSPTQLSFRLAAYSISSTGNGVDGADYVRVEVSPNGGTTYYNTLEIAGNSNAYWSYAGGTATAQTNYDGNFATVNLATGGGGNRTTDGYSIVSITNLPSSINLRVRITVVNNDANERWVVDDFRLFHPGPAAQTLPYTQNFGTTAFSNFPAGFTAWYGVDGSSISTQTGAETSVPFGNSTLTSQAAAFGAEPTGGIYGQVVSSNANLVIATSNSTTDGLNQPITAINTGSNTSINIAYDLIVRFSGSRTMGNALQYRAGTLGSWTTVSSSPESYSASPTLNSVVSKSLSLSGLSTSTVYQFRWIGWRNHASGSTNTSIGLDNVSFTASNPSIAISRVDPGASSVTVGTNNVILQQYNLSVTASNASFTGLNVTTAGTYISADITNLKVRYSTDATLDAGDATLSTLTTPGAAGSKTFPSFTAQTINSGSTGYIFITADVAPGATAGNTISISTNAFTEFTFASGTKTGTDPVATASAKTFSSLVPSIAISNFSPAASNHNGGSTDVVLQRFDLAVTITDATLSGLTVTTAGSFAAADFTNLKVRYSADATLDVADATLSTKTTSLAAGAQVFPSFTSQLITSGSTGYIFVTADIATSATGGNTTNLATTAFSNISFSAGTKTGTDPVAVGNARTIVNSSIAISGSSPAASTHLQSSTDVVLHRFDLAVTSSAATLTGFTVTTAGTYLSADVSNLKVRYSTDATLDGSDATLSTLTTPGVAGSKVFPSFTSQIISSGSTGYIFITADLSATATTGNTISLSTTLFSNISFSSGNKTGTDPVAAGNVRTFIKAEPSNFPTVFTCGTTTINSIPLSFTAATGSVLPDGYLLKWSTTSYAAITDPVDGTALANGTGIQNVTASPYTFTALTSGTTYFFKIWSFSNSGSNINYKLVGEPQTSCATLTAPWEDFETGSKGSYTAADVTLGSGSWNLSDALLGTLANDKKNGLQSMRMQNTGIARMNFNRTAGIGTVDILHAVYGTDGNSTWRLEASTDNGSTWTAYISSTITTNSATLVNQSFSLNLGGNVRLRIVKLSGGSDRISFDDIYVTNFNASITTGAVSTSICAGASGVSVPFTYTPNASFPNGVAIFTAQLSNASGSFGTPTTLQNVTSNASGSQSISVTIPSGTATGTGYRIRVVSTSPSVTGADNGSNISIFNSSTSIAPVTTQNLFTSANGTTLTVTEGSTPTSRQWKYGTVSTGPYGINLGTATTQVPNFASAGTYFMVCESTYGAPCSATIRSNEVQINVTSPTAEINIQGNSTNIVDGDITPATADHTDFGGVLFNAGTIVRTFTIQNTGSANLNLTGSSPFVVISGTNAGDFSITTIPTTPIAAAGSTTFQVTFNPSAAGTRTATLTIANDDSDENPYNFDIQGLGLEPELQLEQPIATNQACGFNYDFGSHLLSTNTDIVVRIRNTGTGQLDGVGVSLSGVDAAEFSFFTTPSATIAAAGFSDFTIRFTPVSGGSKVAIVTITSTDADEGTCEINLYGEGDASPVVPILTSPTVSGITNNAAALGATITSDGNASIISRGTVWKTTSPVIATDNTLVEGGTAVSAFSHLRTSLPSGSQIFYRGYATNSAGTGLSSESSFYTLSNEPVGNAVTFTATAASATQINLSFSGAGTIPASGYIILMKASAAVTGTPNDATVYVVNDVVGDANVVGLISTATSFSVTGLSASTNYHFALVPYNWNGTNNQTRNYLVSPLRAANATTTGASLPVLGDIAFVAYATDAPDRFAFMALADIAANAEIAFTDNAWSSGSAICTNEETVRWAAPATGVLKGTVVRIQGATANVGSIVSGNLSNLSTSGDQIFAYTGTSASPSFITGLSSTTFTGACQACGVNTNASCIASGLTNGINSISFASHADNGYYNGVTYGTAATLRTEINNPVNWIRSGSVQTWPTPWSFTIGNVSITANTISPTSYCVTNIVGTSISIPYTTGGTFETGNVFTAQLSDASGSFAIPTNIGTGAVSPISATIPAGTLNGSGYRVRVVSSDPEANGLQNASNITIFLNTPDASGLSALRINAGAIVNWTNPAGSSCWDQVLVVAQPTNSFTALPTGDGTAYTASSTFLTGTAFGTGGSVVFKGTATTVTIGGFTNGTTYFIKLFIRRGTQWSEGIEVSVLPNPDITGDFRSRVTTGNWSNFASWERYNGTSWVNATSGQFPDNTTTTVTILNGHTITVDGSSDPYDSGNLIVAAGGKLYANLASGNRYLTMYGDITCNGTIGNGATFDGISFNFQGIKSTVSGTGTFDCSRMRRNDVGTTGGTSDLILAMNVNLRWNASSGTAIYNNDNRAPGSRFNVTVNENSVLSCILSTGGTSGNAAIDGVDGGNSATGRAAGTFTINGTMNIPGILYATTDNDATGSYFARWIIGSTGIINCRQLDCTASGAAGHTFEIKQGGKLNINNNNDNTVNPVVNFSTTNNTFAFLDGSNIEYSSADLVGTQKIFINAGFPYKNLILSNASSKQLQIAGTLNVGGDLTIIGGVLDIQTNNIDLKGNWENYNHAAFTEGLQKVTFSGTALQTVQCIGGEQFYNVDIANSSTAGVQLNTDVTLANDLDLGTNGRLSFGATPAILTLSRMTVSSNTFKGSGAANVDMNSAEHTFIIGCPDPGYSGSLNAGTTSTIIYNRDEDFAGSADDQNLLTGFSYANLLLTGKGNKVISSNLTVNANFTGETPDMIISAPVLGRTLTLAGNFSLNSGATMNDNCRDNQSIQTSGNESQIFSGGARTIKCFNLISTKTVGGISLTGALGNTECNIKNDFALDFTGSALFADNTNLIRVGDDVELGSASSTSANFNFTGTATFTGIGASVDLHLSNFAGTGATVAQLNNITVDAGNNTSPLNQVEVLPTGGAQTVTFKGNVEMITGSAGSELDCNNNTIKVGGNWISYSSTAFKKGTTASVEFNGAALQTLTCTGGEIFVNTKMNNTIGGLTLNNNLSTTNLDLTLGKIDLNNNNLTLGTNTINAVVTNENTNSYVITYDLSGDNGTVIHNVNSNTATYKFPVGDLTKYTPASITMAAGTLLNATLTGSVKSIPHPILGTASSFINRYWSIDQSGITNPNYGIVYQYDATDVSGSESILKPFKWNSMGWQTVTGTGAAAMVGTGGINTTTKTFTWSGITTFSEFTGIGDGSPLPIELLSFTATENLHKVDLNWTTASEINNDFFTVERSIDAASFEGILTQPGAGNSNLTRNYVDVDTRPIIGTSYYRLKQTDFNGTATYSQIVAVNFKSLQGFNSVWYDGNLSLSGVTDLKNEEIRLSIYDLSGRLLYEGETTQSGGIFSISLVGFSNSPHGIYLLRIIAGNEVRVTRFVK